MNIQRTHDRVIPFTQFLQKQDATTYADFEEWKANRRRKSMLERDTHISHYRDGIYTFNLINMKSTPISGISP